MRRSGHGLHRHQQASRTRCPTAGRCSTRSSFRVGEGSTTALIGANGAGKTTLLRIIRGDEPAHGGVVSIGGALGVMDQFVGHGARRRDRARPARSRSHRAASAPPRIELEAAEAAIIEHDDLEAQMRYATALADYADAGGYEHETVWDQCTVAALGVPFARARFRELTTLSGGEQKRLALEALLRGPDEVLLLDEPDNYLDVPGKRWLEEQLRATPEDGAARLARPRAARARRRSHRDARDRRRRQHGLGARRQLRDLPPGARRPDGPARRAAPALGRAARQAQGARRRAQGQGDRERRVRVALSGRPDAAARSSRRPARPRSARPSRTCSCGCAGPAPASAPSSPSGSSSPAS